MSFIKSILVKCENHPLVKQNKIFWWLRKKTHATTYCNIKTVEQAAAQRRWATFFSLCFSGKGHGCRKWRGKFLMSWLVSDHTRCELGQNTASSYWNHKDVQTDSVIHTKSHAHLSKILWASTIQSKAWSWGRNNTGKGFLLVCTSSRTWFLSTFSLTCPLVCIKSNMQRQVILVSGSLFCNPDFRGAVLHNSLFKNLHTSVLSFVEPFARLSGNKNEAAVTRSQRAERVPGWECH